MSRTRILTHYKVSLEKEEAIHLAKQVFGLQKKLKISRAQMSAETELTRSSLSSLKSCWVNGKGKGHKTMYPSIANAFVKFWNLHLDNTKRQPKKIKKSSSSGAPIPVQVAPAAAAFVNATFSDPYLQALVDRLGRSEAIKRLAEAGKLAQHIDELQLTDEELIDLIE